MGLTKASLFSGIGGIDLAAHWAGMETAVFCEREPFAQRVLRKHWPDVPIIDDVHNFNREELERRGIIGPGRAIDILSAGFPCQPFSHAGKREGADDERYLWPQVVRVIGELRPTWFVGENVAGILSMAQPDRKIEVVSRILDRTEEEDYYEAVFTQEEIMLINDICKDLEDIGYQVQVFVLPAAAVGASNPRDRVFIVGFMGHSASERLSERRQSRRSEGEEETGAGPEHGSERSSEALADTASIGQQGSREHNESLYPKESAGRQTTEPLNGSKGENVGDTERVGCDRQPRRRSDQEPADGCFAGTGKTLAHATSGRCREARDDIERSAPWTSGSSSMGNSESIVIQGKQSIRIREVERRFTAEQLSRSGDGAGKQGAAQPGMGGSADVLSGWLDGSGVNPLDALTEMIAAYPQPALMGQPQYDWEPPRVATGIKDRTPRLKGLGNAVNPLQIYPIMQAIKLIDDQLQQCEVMT